MLYCLVPFDDEYNMIEYFPRWAYHNDEWNEIISDADKIVNGIMYKLKEPDSEDDKNLDNLVLDMLET